MNNTNFEEWYAKSDVLFDLSYKDLQAAWNAAIDEAVKAVAKVSESDKARNDFDDGLNWACEETAEAIKGLKNEK
jgi:hypothetical protein